MNLEQLYDFFKDKAPGTYRHCEAVASLCEAIASEVPVNKDVLIMAARLHDVGKTVNPTVFSENQGEDNIHDDLTPEQSYQYISRHVGDGLVILAGIKEVPRDVLTVISQHHGTSCILSIYNKAIKDNKDLSKDMFRYRGCRPASKEAAILMITDVVEAATKSLHNRGKLDDIPATIASLIDNLIEDRQLDRMRIGDVRTIKKILSKELDNIYHKRVAYESDKDSIEELD